ncbi:hypothetical protein FACS189430_09940 [Bacteroidia bacterium]|nr:hypothetical protein FACS189430_09940 [Bacteroidia bacterium]
MRAPQAQAMRLITVWISVLCLLQACAVSRNAVTVNETVMLRMANPNVTNRYSATILAGGNRITGILVVKRMNATWRGSLLNEFGVKMFDFISTPEKCSILNIAPVIDKWYIKKILAADFHLLFAVDEPSSKVYRHSTRSVEQDALLIKAHSQTIQRFPNGEVRLQNKRKITYHFIKIEDETSR